MEPRLTVTIARQLGSGGSYVGQQVAERLDARYIDRELLRLAAERLGCAEEEIVRRDERPTPFIERVLGAFGFGAPDGPYTPPPLRSASPREIFECETEILKKVASESDCVIIGRGAGFMLATHPGSLNVFVHAPLAFRMRRVMEIYGAKTPEAARRMIEEADEFRRRYVTEVIGREWGNAENYHLAIDTGVFALDAASDLVVEAVRLKGQYRAR